VSRWAAYGRLNGTRGHVLTAGGERACPRGASRVVAPRRRSRHARLEGRPSRRGRQL